MKQIQIILPLLLCSAMLQSCGDHADDNKLPPFVLEVENQPSAKPADDNKASGVYKGTFVGSTGTFKLIIQSDLIIGYLVVKNEDSLWPESYVLTTNDIQASDLNGAVSNALFANTSQTVKLYFSVDANGSNPQVELHIAGHETIDVAVYKETSETLVKVYEGFLYRTYTDVGVQVKAHFNVLLGPDSLARVTYKTVEEYDLENGISGTKGEESYSSDANYRIDVWPSITQISVYRHILNPLYPGQPNMYISESYMVRGKVNETETEITYKYEWEQEGSIYADSARLARIL